MEPYLSVNIKTPIRKLPPRLTRSEIEEGKRELQRLIFAGKITVTPSDEKIGARSHERLARRAVQNKEYRDRKRARESQFAAKDTAFASTHALNRVDEFDRSGELS